MRRFIRHSGSNVPVIAGGGGGKGSGRISPNSLFSTDILYVTAALGEGPIYRINPNGPQDIQIQDSAIDDLINLDSNGLENTDKFMTISTTGTVTQDPIPKFGDEIVSPQVFASQVTLKNGNIAGVPSSSITLQQTSASDWDALRFTFVIEELYTADTKGNVSPNSVTYRIRIYDYIGTTLITTVQKTISEKTDTAYKFSETVVIPPSSRSPNGYRFSIDKVSGDSDNPRLKDTIKVLSWDELKYTPQAYPRTALIGYALKAMNEYTGGVPNFTSLIKGLLVKVPSNYSQPILANGEIDWRELEVGQELYTTYGYRLQSRGTSTVLYDSNPEIYIGTWDGTFVYSWTQNPVWIIYDILTNKTYGLGIPEENVDKYKFYQIAQYCDACDSTSGRFVGVRAVSDGSFRYKPRTLYSSIRQNQLGLPKGTKVLERRFITDVTISDQEKAMDTLNKLTATFRSMLVYSGGKISLAVDMPDEFPVMLFNETNVKQGSFQIAGIKESEVYTGVDITYIEPTNHFKREVVRLDLAEANDGRSVQTVENIASLDLTGVTRRSQAMRLGQYQLAAARYLRRNITFTTSTEALSLAPGDVISVAMNGTGIAYGYGGRVKYDSLIGSSNTNVTLEHYTVPSLSNSVFLANTSPLALRIIRANSDKMDLYIISNTMFSVTNTGEASTGADEAVVRVTSRFDPISRQIVSLPVGFSDAIAPRTGDLWTIGEFENPNNYYTNKSGKLFKVTGVSRDGSENEVIVSGIEYISNVYIDSDTFINYEPTAYTDITSPFSTPPAPVFTFNATPRTKLDGTVVYDGILNNRTESLGYGQKYETEYYIARPDFQVPVSNLVSTSPLRFSTSDASSIANNTLTCVVSGKNGFTTPAGDIRLLCNAISTPTVGQLTLTLEGLRLCLDENFNQHFLAVNDGVLVPTLKGIDQVNLPVREKANIQSLINFVGYQSDVTSITREILSYNLNTDTINIEDSVAGSSSLASSLLNPPFYVSLNQILAKNYYANNSIYVRGTEIKQVIEGELNTGSATSTIILPNKPRKVNEVRVFIDGIQKASGLYTVNINNNSTLKANIQYTNQPVDRNYRVEVDYYTVPSIEVGDRVEVNYGNVFTVINTSYDTASAKYNAALTSNSIFRIQLDSSPELDLSGYSFINVTQNPVGTAVDVQNNNVTISYNTDTYPGLFNLANNGIYTLDIASNYERIFLTSDSTIPELPLGVTTVRARNKNTLGRLSPYVSKSVLVEQLPIQRVQNLLLEESLYREQTGGVAVRVTCSFDSIIGQEVTDYEISYKLGEVNNEGIDDAGTPLTFFNTVKVPASGVDSDGKIRFTINNINRGITAESNSITVRVTPLNKNIRGYTTTAEIAIKGKTVPPQNVFGFTGGQQNEVITFFWNYVRSDGDLVDLDLKEVIVNRLPGEVPITLENFLAATPLVTVSVPSARKSIPIDNYGTYTYLVRTRDTSGNLSTDVVGTTITTTRAQRSTVVAAYNEDNPAESFIDSLVNSNSTEFYFPSFANSTGGLSGPSKSRVDNANGSSSGWSVISGAPTNLLAPQNASYITQIRDFGQTVVGQINIEVEATQQVQTTYNDQHEEYLESVSDTSTLSNVLVDASFGGIGRILGFSNALVTTGRYDSNNRTWMTGPANGNVWAIWNHGQFNGDTANANSYALIAGLINVNAIALGESYFANGSPTGSNSLSNITSGNDTYTLVNLVQYNDTGSATYVGTLGVVTSQTLIRTSSSNVYYANGNVNVSAFSSSGEGWIPYEAGTKSFRYFQIKYYVNNSRPDEFDFTLDRLRYSISKEQTIFTDTVTYDTSPKTVSIASASFLYNPIVNFTVSNQIDAESNPAIVITTALSNQSVSFKLYASDGSGPYQANSTANIMITAIGV